MDPEPIDPAQVHTIGRVHHGMLFQHVLAARCVAQELLTPGFFEQLVVERDEDIEIGRSTGRIYIQAKAHEHLVFSELKDALVRMHKVRIAHVNGVRSGTCQLFFALGGSLGDELQKRDGSSKSNLESKVRAHAQVSKLASEDDKTIDPESLLETWRAIEWLTPDTKHPDFTGVHFRGTVNELLADLATELGKVSRLADSPSSAAYALSTSMHALAADSLSGFTARRLLPADVPRLVGVVEQHIQTLPPLPTPYVPMPTSSTLFSLGQPKVLLGSTGSGKSTHLAYAAINARVAVLYLQPSEPGPAAIRECVLQLRQHLIKSGVPASELLAPNADVPLAEVIEMQCSKLLPNTFVVVDDAHLLVDTSPGRLLLRGIASRAANGLTLCGLPQQENGGSTAVTVSTLLGRAVDVLDMSGWTKTNIAEFLYLKRTPQDPVTASNLQSMCGGHPAAVQALIDLATRHHGGDIDEAIASARQGRDDGMVSAVVTAHFASLPPSARRVATVVATTRIPPEIQTLAKLIDPDEAATGLRHLLAHRCLTKTPNGVRVHDLYAHAAALAAADTIPTDERKRIHARAASMLEEEVRRTQSHDAVPLWLLNVGLGGDIESVVRILTDGGDLWIEALQRIGVGTPIAYTIERLVPFAMPVQRFWLYDCLIFLNYEEELRFDQDQLWHRYQESYDAAKDPNLDPDNEADVDEESRREAAYLTKGMVRAKDKQDGQGLDVLWIQVQKLQKRHRSFTMHAVLNSVYASCLYDLGDYEDVWSIALSNINLYLMQLHLSDEEFWKTPPEALIELLQEREADPAVLSRLGDALLLVGMCLRELEEWPAEIFARAKFLFKITGGEKAFYKAELHMARQFGRSKSYLQIAITLMESRLAQFKHIGFDGALVVTTCTLAALHEAAGNNERAELLLSELVHFPPEEVREEIAAARVQTASYTAASWGWRTLAVTRRAE